MCVCAELSHHHQEHICTKWMNKVYSWRITRIFFWKSNAHIHTHTDTKRKQNNPRIHIKLHTTGFVVWVNPSTKKTEMVFSFFDENCRYFWSYKMISIMITIENWRKICFNDGKKKNVEINYHTIEKKWTISESDLWTGNWINESKL